MSEDLAWHSPSEHPPLGVVVLAWTAWGWMLVFVHPTSKTWCAEELEVTVPVKCWRRLPPVPTIGFLQALAEERKSL